MQRRMPLGSWQTLLLLGVQTAYPDSTLFDSKRVFEMLKVLLGRDKKPILETGNPKYLKFSATT